EPCAEDLPALDASFDAITGIDVDRFGRLYVVDRAQRCVFRLEAGIVRRVAGVCELPDGGGGGGKGERGPGESFSGGLALDAFLDGPFDVAVLPDGAFYVSDRDDGQIGYVVGGRIYGIETGEGISFSRPQALHAAADGALYVADAHRILRYDRAGALTVVAGTGVDAISPDGDDAATSPIDDPGGLLAIDSGRVYFVEQGAQTLRYVDGDGALQTAAGDGTREDTPPGSPARATGMRAPTGLAIAPSGAVLIVDSAQDRIFALEGSMSDFDDEGYRVTELDGRVTYEFDAQGRHLRTRHGLTGTTLLSFGYDGDGLLSSITDADGLSTTVTRSGATTTITSPFGQVSTLAIDAQGDLAALTNPASEAHAFTYGFGLLETATDPRGGVKAYQYDARGRLEVAEDEGEGSQTFGRFKRRGSDDHTVRRTTAEGVESRYVLRKWSTGEELRTQRLPNGETMAMTSNRATGRMSIVTPSGLQITQDRVPDPRFGMQAGYPSRRTSQQPSGLTREETAAWQAVFTDPSDSLSLSSLQGTTTINGRTSTQSYDASTRRWSLVSAAGRTTEIAIDARGRTSRIESPQTEPLSIQYGATGKIASAHLGDDPLTQRSMTFTYDALNRVRTLTAPAGRVLTYGYDAADRVTTLTLPDGAAVGFDYDDQGNRTALTPPGRPAHTFAYAPTRKLTHITMPDAGSGTATEIRTYDDDQRIASIQRADGRLITYAYDPIEHQLVGMTSPRGATVLTYDEPSDVLASITEPDGEVLTFTHDGTLLTSVTWSGVVNGSVAWTYNSDYRPVSTTVNGVDPIAYAYDDDSRLTAAGAMAIGRETDTGRVSTTALGRITTAQTYTVFDEPDVYSVFDDGTLIYREDLDYNARGWVTRITREQSGTTRVWDYGYDLRGQLETVQLDSAPFASYGHDANHNRTQYTGSFGAITPVDVTVDARDRLRVYGDRSYDYAESGELTRQTQSTASVTYDYDVFGSLRQAVLADGTVIGYVTDGVHRRIGKTVNGALTQGFLYQDALNPVAELDGAGAVVSRFVYGEATNVPEFMIRGGVTYRIVSDHLGSPRLVVDAATGIVAQEMRYDAFGRILLDTNPGFQPFGFAGGIDDRSTGLIRFGARDYDPIVGRWTAPDPIGFASESWNLYAYVDQNPVSFIDRSGESKGGKRNLAGNDPLTQGLDPNQSRDKLQGAIDDVKDWLKSGEAKENAPRARNLRGWLKVAQRGTRVLGAFGSLLSLVFVDELNADEYDFEPLHGPPTPCDQYLMEEIWALQPPYGQ
ncbi:MAG: RHS repeat-associated core domain-containing protein, partial [Acidobacteriota bacterium]